MNSQISFMFYGCGGASNRSMKTVYRYTGLFL